MEVFVVFGGFGHEKTKPILGQVKSKKVKGKMKSSPEFLRRGDLKKQSQFAVG